MADILEEVTRTPEWYRHQFLDRCHKVDELLQDAAKRQSLAHFEAERQRFLNRFGPEQLETVGSDDDVLALLHDIGAKNGLYGILERDSLLEAGFGSGHGGFSHTRYTVYLSREKEWKLVVRGKPYTCSQAEAVTESRRVIQALLAGAVAADAFHLTSGDPEAWERFQAAASERRLSEFLGWEGAANEAVIGRGWAHKYLAVNNPSAFSLHHNPDHLAFHLRLLTGSQPPTGRWRLDGEWQRFVRSDPVLPQFAPTVLMRAAYETLGLPTVRQRGTTRYWRIGTSEGPNAIDRWPTMSEGGFASIGWGDLGDLAERTAGLTQPMAITEMADFLQPRVKNNYRQTATKYARQWYSFAKQIQPGDRVAAMKGHLLLGIGVVPEDAEYTFVADDALQPHHLPVNWLVKTTEQWSSSRRLRTTVDDMTDDPNVRAFLESRLESLLPAYNGQDNENAVSMEPVNKTTPPFDDLMTFLRESGLSFSEEVVANYLLALQAKRFVLLTGISGTGKTQLALSVAKFYRPKAGNNLQAFSTESVDADRDAIATTVRRYHLKYARTILPISLTRRMQFSGLEEQDDPQKRTLRVHYPDGVIDQTYYQDKQSGRNVTQLLFKGAFKEWFKTNLSEGDTFLLDIEPSEDGEGPDGVRFSLPSITADAKGKAPVSSMKPVIRAQATDVVVAVRPDWTDHRGLLGYYNPLTERYQVTPFLQLLLNANAEARIAKAADRIPQPFFAILDEMNLARVEHYFADFLSCLESGQPLHLHDDLAIEEGENADGVAVPRTLTIPDNLYFTGTVNIDETTYMFSPKVLDRAFTLEFNEVDLSAYGAMTVSGEASRSMSFPLRLEFLPSPLKYPGKPGEMDWIRLNTPAGGRLRQAVVALNALLAEEHRHFGYRVANEIARYVDLAFDQTNGAIQSGPSGESLGWDALDLALLQKVLPRLHGTQQELETILQKMMDFTQTAGEGPTVTSDSEIPARLPRMEAKLKRMLSRVRRHGFTSFME